MLFRSGGGDNLLLPVGQGRVQMVKHPLGITPRGQQTGIAQRRKVTRYLRLGQIERCNKFAYAEFALILHQRQGPQAGLVGQHLKDFDLFHTAYMRQSEYAVKRIFDLTYIQRGQLP